MSECEQWPDDQRIDLIGQNGNDGLHYHETTGGTGGDTSQGHERTGTGSDDKPGGNSKRRCKHCRAYFSEWVTYPAGTFCTVDHALAFAYQPKQREKAYRVKTAERKKALLDTDRKHWMAKAREAFNGFIRDRDSGLPCVSCGRGEAEVNQSEGWKPGGAWDCGHYLSVGSHPELRFEPLNAHRQCKSCNGGSGNYTRKNHQVAAAYRVELVKRIGLEKVEWLEGPHEPKKYTVDDLKAIAAEYRIKRRELQKSHYEDIEYA